MNPALPLSCVALLLIGGVFLETFSGAIVRVWRRIAMLRWLHRTFIGQRGTSDRRARRRQATQRAIKLNPAIIR